jgi:hypothetical protein
MGKATCSSDHPNSSLYQPDTPNSTSPKMPNLLGVFPASLWQTGQERHAGLGYVRGLASYTFISFVIWFDRSGRVCCHWYESTFSRSKSAIWLIFSTLANFSTNMSFPPSRNNRLLVTTTSIDDRDGHVCFRTFSGFCRSRDNAL